MTAWTQPADREVRLARHLVTLADILGDRVDETGLLDALALSCEEVLGVHGAAALLSDDRADLRLLSATNEPSRVLARFQLQDGADGPCVECLTTRAPVVIDDLSSTRQRWPSFSTVAVSVGFHCAVALPMRVRSEVIGSVLVLDDKPWAFDGERPALAHILVDMASIGLMQQRSRQHSERLVRQLQKALDSRIVIEQAKGLLAATGPTDMPSAFEQLRRYSRRNNVTITEAAQDLGDGRLSPLVFERPA